MNAQSFSVKPDQPLGPEKIMEIFRDTFEGTDYDMTKTLTVTDELSIPDPTPATVTVTVTAEPEGTTI